MRLLDAVEDASEEERILLLKIKLDRFRTMLGIRLRSTIDTLAATSTSYTVHICNISS